MSKIFTVKWTGQQLGHSLAVVADSIDAALRAARTLHPAGRNFYTVETDTPAGVLARYDAMMADWNAAVEASDHGIDDDVQAQHDENVSAYARELADALRELIDQPALAAAAHTR